MFRGGAVLYTVQQGLSYRRLRIERHVRSRQAMSKPRKPLSSLFLGRYLKLRWTRGHFALGRRAALPSDNKRPTRTLQVRYTYLRPCQLILLISLPLSNESMAIDISPSYSPRVITLARILLGQPTKDFSCIIWKVVEKSEKYERRKSWAPLYRPGSFCLHPSLFLSLSLSLSLFLCSCYI